MQPDRFDDLAFYLGDPHATYRCLRVEDPVRWYEESQFRVLTKYADIKFVSSNPLLFHLAASRFSPVWCNDETGRYQENPTKTPPSCSWTRRNTAPTVRS
jgi:cytochrome P450